MKTLSSEALPVQDLQLTENVPLEVCKRNAPLPLSPHTTTFRRTRGCEVITSPPDIMRRRRCPTRLRPGPTEDAPLGGIVEGNEARRKRIRRAWGTEAMMGSSRVQSIETAWVLIGNLV